MTDRMSIRCGLANYRCKGVKEVDTLYLPVSSCTEPCLQFLHCTIWKSLDFGCCSRERGTFIQPALLVHNIPGAFLLSAAMLPKSHPYLGHSYLASIHFSKMC
jgi:hypothetical protein